MDELADIFEFGVIRDLLFDQILDRLDIVVGAALDRLDALRIHDAKLVDDALEFVAGLWAERRHLGDAGMVRQ